MALLINHGAIPQTFTAGDADGTVTVHLGADAAVREFVEMVKTAYPGTELTAQRTREQRDRTVREVRAAVDETLTDRQFEVLRTAYHSGYFEQPRARNGSEIAASLDITQPTFTHHLRTAHRKLCGVLLGTDGLTHLDDSS